MSFARCAVVWKGVALAVVCALVSAAVASPKGNDSSARSLRKLYEGEAAFALERPIYLNLASVAKGAWGKVKTRGVEFRGSDKALSATVHLVWSGEDPAVKWQSSVVLLDAQGQEVARAAGVFSRGGERGRRRDHGGGRDARDERDVEIGLGGVDRLDAVKKVRVLTESVDAETSLTAEAVKSTPEQIERWKLSLAVEVQHPDGQTTAQSFATLWVRENALMQVLRRRLDDRGRWRDPKSGEEWIPLTCSGSPHTMTLFEDLMPGEYRVTAWEASGKTDVSEFPPQAESGVVRLEAGEPVQHVALRFASQGAALSLRAVEGGTTNPVSRATVELWREGSLPVGGDMRGTLASTTGTGELKFRGLSPGKYWLCAHKCAYGYGHPELAAGAVAVTVEAGKESRLEIAMNPRSFSAAEVEERWPFVITGRITDGGGLPLEGVLVQVGHGDYSMFRYRHKAVTDAEGRYTVRVDQVGSMDQRSGGRRAHFEPVVFSASKSGYVVKGLASRHAGQTFYLCDTPPSPEQVSRMAEMRAHNSGTDVRSREEGTTGVEALRIAVARQPLQWDLVLLPRREVQLPQE